MASSAGSAGNAGGAGDVLVVPQYGAAPTPIVPLLPDFRDGWSNDYAVGLANQLAYKDLKAYVDGFVARRDHAARDFLEVLNMHVPLLYMDVRNRLKFTQGYIPRTAELFEALAETDVLLVSVRRRALPAKHLAALRRYVDAGKPLIGIRTANHGFLGNFPYKKNGKQVRFGDDVMGGAFRSHGLTKKHSGSHLRGIPTWAGAPRRRRRAAGAPRRK